MKLRHLWDTAARRASDLPAWFFRGRYQLLARVFGLQPEGGAGSPKGTLFIEIDGLGYGHLIKAIERGYLPFVKSLLESGEYRVHRWRCGLAADTPPIQSGLMYGTSEGIVGFYWWDRRTQRRIVGANPYQMREVQARVARQAAKAGDDALLAGGSSYSNIMSGGARYAVLTIAGVNPHWYRPGQGLLRALAVLALNPGRVARFVFDAAWELVQEMEDRAFVTAMDRPRVLEGAFPLVRLLLNLLAREIVTAGTRVDMLRGVPVIYSCYIGYDIVGHHSGPLSRNSLRVLRGIDASIRRLFVTRAWAERRYDIVLLSDHGMTGCQSVALAFDQEFEDWVEKWWKQGAQASPTYRADRRRVRRRLRRRVHAQRGNWRSRLAGEVARRSSAWLRTWGRIGAWTLELGSAGAIKLGERFLEDEGGTAAPRIAVISCGPLSQLWVREVDRRLNLSEVEALCPGFARALVDHPAVGVVIGREGDQIVVLGHDGKAVLRVVPPRRRDSGGRRRQDADGPAPAAPGLPEDAADPVIRIEGENPLALYEEPAVAARQIASFASMEACGDVICFAAPFRPDTLRDATPGAVGETHVYSFEHQLGTHAALGGDQAYPFIMLPAGVPFDGSSIAEASQLYPFLKDLVRGQTPAAAAAADDGAEKRVISTRGGSKAATIGHR